MKPSAERVLRPWLRDMRVAKKLSQHDLAVRVDVTATAVHAWEAGKATPLPPQRRALALELGDEVLQRFFAEELDALAAAKQQGDVA